MPDAFENFNMAMQSMLTNNAIADNEDLYFPLNDLAPMSNIGALSPYSNSGSQEASITSPMSMSSSPAHITDCYVNLNNATVTILGEPHISILVQPMDKFRFRYQSEMVATHGSLLGVSNGRRRNKNNVPTVQLQNFLEPAVIRCTLVTADDNRTPHAHRLVRRVDAKDEDDPHEIEVSQDNNFTAEFNNMGILHTARRGIKDEIVQKMRFKALEECKRRNRRATLNIRDEAQIKADAEHYQKSMNLNSVALCFQGFIKDGRNVMRPITEPVYSNSINNLKSALTGELKICRIDKYTSSCEGGEEVFMLVEKVSKKNIKIKFFEMNDDGIETWCDYGRFSELDVHHQYAVVFRTPPYRDLNIVSPREVFIILERPSDADCSDPIKFTYKPSDRMMGRKRTRVSCSSSGELAQMTLNQHTPLTTALSTTTPLMNMPTNNESSEISNELKKLLEERCSSSDFQTFVANINLDLYEHLLDEENKLTFDGTATEDDKLFAKNIVIDTMQNIKMKPDKAKDIIINVLKDRTTYGDSPLHCALRYGQKDIVKRILMLMSTLKSDAEELVNIQNSSGRTPLHYAALQDQPEITKALLMLGADPNIVDNDGQMPLHCAAARIPDAAANVEVLLSDKRINVEANTDKGWAPIHLAAQAGSRYVVRFLVKAGANVNNTDRTYGRTALHIAVEGSHKDIIEYLLKQPDIDVNKGNFSGNTPLHTAVVTQGKKAKEICALLLKHGADPHLRNYNREQGNIAEEARGVKTEKHSDDENMECTGQSSFDLALNQPDILQLVSSQTDAFLELPNKVKIKEENTEIEDTLRVWLDADQEQELASILDKTKGWKKLASHFHIDFLLDNLEFPSMLLLSYVSIQTEISLEELQKILHNLNEEDAAVYLGQVLSQGS